MQSLYIDIDGVIYNWDKAAHSILERETGKKLTHPSPSWDSLEAEAGPEAWKALWEIYDGELFTRGPAIEDAAWALRRLWQHYLITLITSRPESAEASTRQWLKQEDIPFDDLVICGRHSSKPQILPEPPAFFIDDKPQNIIEAQKDWHLSDEQVILFSALYNKPFNHPSRVKGWDEILEKLL